MSFSTSIRSALALGAALLLVLAGVPVVSAAPASVFQVGVVSPTTASIFSPVMLSTTLILGDKAISSCSLYLDGGRFGSPLVAGDVQIGSPSTQVFSGSFSITTAGTYNAQVQCTDSAGNSVTSEPQNLVVSSDDFQPPTVTSAAYTGSVFPNQLIPLSATYNDAGQVSFCQVEINGSRLPFLLQQNRVSGTVSHELETNMLTPGSTNTYRFSCTDVAGNIGYSQLRTLPAFSVDVTAPTISGVTPASGYVNEQLTINASYADAVGITGCTMAIAGPGGISIAPQAMTRNGGATSGNVWRSYTPTSVGSYTFTIVCTDGAGNSRTLAHPVTIASRTAPDTTSPVIGALTPTTAVAGTPVTFSATHNDSVGVTSCFLIIDGTPSNTTLSGTSQSGTASRSHTFSSSGSYQVTMSCFDAAGNNGVSTRTVVVSSAAGVPVVDSVAPSLSSLSPLTATRGAATTISVGYSDAVGVTACTLLVNTITQGSMTLGSAMSGTATRSHTFSAAGSYTLKVNCQDQAGNVATASATVVVSEPTTTPTPTVTFPTVGLIPSVTVSVNAPATLSATVSDAGSTITRCDLYVNGVLDGAMTVSGGIASRSRTFTAQGTYLVYVRCTNAAGNSTNGTTTSVVAAASTTPTPTPTPTTPVTPTPTTPGTTPVTTVRAPALMKLACPNYVVAADHPCKAVYYYGLDGRRHAFPNSQVYFTWFNDFSSVVEVTSSFLASVPLGRNVTYRPGVRMVKFTTLDRVYAVGRGGVLRWVMTEEVARGLYGSNWARQIDDIADVFFTDYQFGTDISSGTGYSPSGEALGTTTIDQSW